MNYFILTFMVVIGGTEIEFVKAGRIVKDLDYTPNAVRDRIKDDFTKRYPGSAIAVKLHEKEKVSEEEYNNRIDELNIKL